MTERLKKALDLLSESESKTLLMQILIRLQSVQKNEYTEKQFADNLKDIYDGIIEKTCDNQKPIKTEKEIHIAFGDSAAGTVKHALYQVGSLNQRNVLTFPDVLSVGPVYQLDRSLEQRFSWLARRFNHFREEEMEDDQRRFKEACAAVRKLPDQLPVSIWTADNAFEQTGLRLVLYLLKDRDNPIHLMNLSNLNDPLSGVYYLYTGEVPPEEIRTVYKQYRQSPALMPEQRREMEHEWEKLSDRKDVLRIWQDEQILGVPEQYFDSLILKKAKQVCREEKNRSFLCARLIGEVIGQVYAEERQYIPDVFFEYRIRKLIEKGHFVVTGVPRGLRHCYIKPAH